MNPSIRRIFSTIAAIALLFNLFATAAFAKSSRTALITDVSGDVTVTKGGGSNPIPAFPNMPLNQGDSIETGDDGSVKVKIADPESERTIGPNSSVTVTKLAEDAGGKKNGFKVFVGSMWNKIKSLASGNEDEVDTPTATMGVRGTQYLLIVNPDGTLSVVVASGLVAAKLTTSGDSGSSDTAQKKAGPNTVLLAPTQQINLNPNAMPSDLSNAVQIADVTNIVKQASPSIIKAFIIDAPSIAEENKALVDQLKSSLQSGEKPVLQRGDAVSDLTVNNLDDLNKITQNMNNLLGNIAANAVTLGKVDSSELAKLIDKANSSIADPNAKINLNAKPLDQTAGVDPNQAKKKKDEQDRIDQLLQQQQSDRERQAALLAQQIGDLIKQALDRAKQVEAENKKAADAIAKQAETAYVSGLTGKDKDDFDKNKKNIEQEANSQQNNNQQNNNQQPGDNSNSNSKPNAVTELMMNDMSPSISGKGPAGLNVFVEGLDGSNYKTLTSGTISSSGTFNLSGTQILPAGTKLRAYTSNGGSNSDYFEAEVQAGDPIVNSMTSPSLVTGMAGVGSQVQVFLGTELLGEQIISTLSGTFSIALSREIYDQTLTVTSTSANGQQRSKTVAAPTHAPASVGSVSIAAVNQTANGFDMQVKLKGFTGANEIYGAELHILSNDFTDHISTIAPIGTPVRNDKFTSANSVDIVKPVFGVVEGVQKLETIYAVTNFNTTNKLSFDDEVLVTIPFHVTKAGTYTFTLPYVLIVDSNGAPVATADTSGLSVSFTK